MYDNDYDDVDDYYDDNDDYYEDDMEATHRLHFIYRGGMRTEDYASLEDAQNTADAISGQPHNYSHAHIIDIADGSIVGSWTKED